MPLVLPITITQGPPRKADILLDSTCFSSADFDNLSDFDADSDTDTDSDAESHNHLFFNLSKSIDMATKRRMQDSEAQADIQ